MLSEKERDIADQMSKLVLDIMTLSNPPEIPDCYASIDSLQTLYAELISLRDFLFAASSGDLSKRFPYKGFIAGTLKTLQANLRHMTWQTKMVASGDFTQRVDFMGEFAESFNTMVTQFEQTLKELMIKERAVRQTNEDLQKENAIREKTEIALRESEKAFRRLSITDPLTGLFNRRHFYKLAEIEISKAIRYSRPLSLIMNDIDFFKKINDTYGHFAGDMVIKTVAEIITREIRTGDMLARYGGEEFIVLLPETSAPGAAAIAERLREQIEKATIRKGKHQISVTVSFGVSDYLFNLSNETLERIMSEFIATADQALYVSKNYGRNKVTVYEPSQTSYA